MNGKTLYTADGGHGATGHEGAIGPSLTGEKSKKTYAALMSWIKNPLPHAETYPSPLSAKDVNDVAAFVERL